MKNFAREFKEFALKGNVMSLAVGVIIGAAFQAVVTSLTDNILSPIIGLFVRHNFDELEWYVLGVSLRYGAFVTSLINFAIMAFAVFLIVRAMNRLLSHEEKKSEPAPPERYCPYCVSAVHADATRCPSCTSEILEL